MASHQIGRGGNGSALPPVSNFDQAIDSLQQQFRSILTLLKDESLNRHEKEAIQTRFVGLAKKCNHGADNRLAFEVALSHLRPEEKVDVLRNLLQAAPWIANSPDFAWLKPYCRDNPNVKDAFEKAATQDITPILLKDHGVEGRGFGFELKFQNPATVDRGHITDAADSDGISGDFLSMVNRNNAISTSDGEVISIEYEKAQLELLGTDFNGDLRILMKLKVKGVDAVAHAEITMSREDFIDFASGVKLDKHYVFGKYLGHMLVANMLAPVAISLAIAGAPLIPTAVAAAPAALESAAAQMALRHLGQKVLVGGLAGVGFDYALHLVGFDGQTPYTAGRAGTAFFAGAVAGGIGYTGGLLAKNYAPLAGLFAAHSSKLASLFQNAMRGALSGAPLNVVYQDMLHYLDGHPELITLNEQLTAFGFGGLAGFVLAPVFAVLSSLAAKGYIKLQSSYQDMRAFLAKMGEKAVQVFDNFQSWSKDVVETIARLMSGMPGEFSPAATGPSREALKRRAAVMAGDFSEWARVRGPSAVRGEVPRLDTAPLERVITGVGGDGPRRTNNNMRGVNREVFEQTKRDLLELEALSQSDPNWKSVSTKAQDLFTELYGNALFGQETIAKGSLAKLGRRFLGELLEARKRGVNPEAIYRQLDALSDAILETNEQALKTLRTEFFRPWREAQRGEKLYSAVVKRVSQLREAIAEAFGEDPPDHVRAALQKIGEELDDVELKGTWSSHVTDKIQKLEKEVEKCLNWDGLGVRVRTNRTIGPRSSGNHWKKGGS